MKSLKRIEVRKILHILMLFCAACTVCSACILLWNQWQYHQGDVSYRKISQAHQSSKAAGTELKEQKEPIDFTALRKINPEVVGWIAAPGTEIDYPVVQGKDNAYYLRRLFSGEWNKLGSIFMDYRNTSNFSDRNTIIYGHNMKNTSMFSSLSRYKEQGFYASYPSMMIYTPEGDFKVELFAGTVVDGSYEAVRRSFRDDRDFQDYIESLEKKSTFKAAVTVEKGERIVTLCTCSYEFSNARYALFGKLTPMPHL